MKKKRITRRQMLRGLGGFTLGLPFLPSLLPGPAYGQEPVFDAPKRFVALTSGHGAVFASATFPESPEYDATETVIGDYEVRRAPLVRRTEGSDAYLSSIYRAPASELTEALVRKMNLLNGITIPWGIMHNTGGMLGNFARNDGNAVEGQLAHPYPTPTIDEVMAWSPSFYADMTNIVRRSVYLGPMPGLSWNFTNPSARSGAIVESARFGSPRDAYDALYVAPPTEEDPIARRRRRLVDLVHGEYRSLRQSNRRLSSEDRARLDEHIARLDELERRLDVVAECRALEIPGSVTGRAWAEVQSLYNDVIAMAFLCGTTRVAVMGLNEPAYVPEAPGDWHNGIAHNASVPENQAYLQSAHRRAFRHGFLDLVRKLDVEESPGQTVLDSSLVAWLWESDEMTHENVQMPVLMAGSAKGFFRTGMYCDYRDLSPGGELRVYGQIIRQRPGLPHNQLLATFLQAMDVPPSEFNSIPSSGFMRETNPPPVTGYGFAQITFPFVGSNANEGRHNALDRTWQLMQDMNEILPFLAA